MNAGRNLPAWWPYPVVEVELSPLARFVRSIEAHNHDPIVDQSIFAWGNPGTIAGHTLDSESVDRAPGAEGGGNYTAFLRIILIQTRSTADQNLTRTYKLQYSKNSGTWTDVTAASSNVRVVDDTNNADGANITTQRLSNQANTFQAGEYDEGDGVVDAITWASVATRETELLWSLEFVDADLAASDTVDFRVLESGGTLLNNDATSDKPRLTWNAPAVVASDVARRRHINHLIGR